jgi:hypothetical protein
MMKDSTSARSDEQCFRILAAVSSTDEERREALDWIYRCHAPGLYRYCLRRYARRMGEDEIADLITDVFVNDVPRVASQFSWGAAAKCGEPIRALRYWLAQLAQWRFLKRLRQRRCVDQSVDPAQQAETLIAPAIHEGISEPDDNDMRRWKSAFATLSDREKDVLVTTAKHTDERTGSVYLPGHERERLCARWHVRDAAHIRKIRERAIAKLRSVESRLAATA